MNANRQMRGLRIKAGRVTTVLEELEAANAVLQPLIEAPLAPKIPAWFSEVVNQTVWKTREKLERELTRLDQKIEKAANAANRPNRPNARQTMYPELTDIELSVLENEIEYLMKDAKVLQRDDCPAFTQVEFNKAVEVGNADVVHLLLHDQTIDPSADDNRAIRVASYFGQIEVVKVLLADPRLLPDKPDPSANYNDALRGASENGYTDVVKLLLADARVNPSVGDNCAICVASENGHTDVVNVLLADSRVDPSVYSNWAIRIASKNGRTDVVKVLLADARVDPSANHNEALLEASRKGRLNVVNLLLERREVVAEGLSREHIAEGKTAAIRKLLREKLNVVGGRRTRTRTTRLRRTTRRTRTTRHRN